MHAGSLELSAPGIRRKAGMRSPSGLAVLFRSIGETCAKVRTSLELRKYTPYTIAAYFRKLGAQVGNGCFIVPTSLGTEPYLVKIGDHVAIAHGVTFSTHDGAAWVLRDQQQPDLQVYGPIIIRDHCFIGLGSILCPNITIGPNSIVAAGSVVISDVPPNTVVMGVPARPWGSVDKYREKCIRRWAEQRPPGVVVEPGETWWDCRNLDANRRLLRQHLLKLFDGRMKTP